MTPIQAISLSNFTFSGEPHGLQKQLEKSLVAEPVEGWRFWKLARREEIRLDAGALREMAAAYDTGGNPFSALLSALGWRLFPYSAQGVWTPSMEASCGGHAAPDQSCGCGLWAFKNIESLAGYIADSVVCVYGRVEMWGRIIEHRNGYRAQYARPVELRLVRGTDEQADELRRVYGIDIQREETPEIVRKWEEEQRRQREKREQELYGIYGTSKDVAKRYHAQLVEESVEESVFGLPKPLKPKPWWKP